MQKVKTHFNKNKSKKFDKRRLEEFQDENVYTWSVGLADIHRLKSLEHTDKYLTSKIDKV
jgi:hypothetical protein